MQYHYLPNSEKTRKQMLAALNLNSIDELFRCCVPENVRFKGELDLPAPLSELEIQKLMAQIAGKNKPASNMVSFLGAGVADHFIPAVVDHIISRSEFYTAYTPYQPEVSQGTLQSIFEFQSMICFLTGMDIANASMYDGGSALAEAAMMAAGHTRLSKILVSGTVHPEYRETLKTYAWAGDLEVVEVPHKDGRTDLEKLEEMIDEKTACFIGQQPNFFGIIEDVEGTESITHKQKKALFITAVDPLSLGILKPPAQYGADIVIGEGQPLGNPPSFGGPHLGFFAAKQKLLRKMPGRIIGVTEDVGEQRGFVMTMQTREQHIRRHRATSNICSNQALCALAANVYLCCMGKNGLAEVAELCLQKSNYLKEAINNKTKFEIAFPGPTFKEFVIKSSLPWEDFNGAMVEKGILPGVHLGRFYPELRDHILVCVTEKRTKAELDNYLAGLEGM